MQKTPLEQYAECFEREILIEYAKITMLKMQFSTYLKNVIETIYQVVSVDYIKILEKSYRKSKCKLGK